MILKDRVAVLVKEKLQEEDYFLVSLKVSVTNDITILFDSMKGVSFKDCLNLSRYIDQNLDREIEDYSLNVSSPGLGTPFQVKEQYLKNIGREIKIITKEGRRLKGILISYGKGLVIQKYNKSNNIEDIRIDLEQIKETKLVVKFK